MILNKKKTPGTKLERTVFQADKIIYGDGHNGGAQCSILGANILHLDLDSAYKSNTYVKIHWAIYLQFVHVSFSMSKLKNNFLKSQKLHKYIFTDSNNTERHRVKC